MLEHVTEGVYQYSTPLPNLMFFLQSYGSLKQMQISNVGKCGMVHQFALYCIHKVQ